ncbi:MAG: peptidylprolyl isomerase [Vicinamibacterales bacterium]
MSVLSSPARLSVVGLLVLAAAAAACRGTSTPAAPAVTADTWATVDGRAITRDDVDKAFRRVGPGGAGPSEEEQLTAKLTLLNDLILRDILVAKATELKIELPDTELDSAYAEARQGIPDDQYQQELTRRNLTADDMRQGLRRELLAQKVIDREVVAKVSLSEQEIADFYAANRQQFNFPEEAYHIAQIVVTVDRAPQPVNRTGDDAGNAKEAQGKVERLMERLKAGEPFSQLAVDYSEDPQSGQRGGDLGFVPVSTLRQAPAALRDSVLKAEPGTVSVVSAPQGHTIVLLIAKEAAGQRELKDPAVQERITGELRGRKEGLLRAAYLGALREDAQVVNYIARRLVEGQGKMPAGVLPASPGSR